MPRNITSAERHRALRSDISPRYPSYAEQQEKLYQRRETIVARTFLAAFASAPVFWTISTGANALLIAGVGAAGFVVTCFYAGNRQYKKHQG